MFALLVCLLSSPWEALAVPTNPWSQLETPRVIVVEVTAEVKALEEDKPVWNDGHWWIKTNGIWIFRDEAGKRWVSELGTYEFKDGTNEWTSTVQESLMAPAPNIQQKAASNCPDGRCPLYSIPK